MSESMLPDNGQRVRPATGILALLLGVFAVLMYLKGYTASGPGTAWLRLLHFIGAISAALWGLKSVLFGRKRRRIDSWFSRLMPYHMEVTREGWIYFCMMMAVLLGALIGKSNLLLLVFGLLAGPFVLNGRIALTMLARNQIVRHLPERAMQGDWFSIDLTLSNKRWIFGSWMMVVEDHWHRGAEHLFPVIVFTRVGPSQERTGRYQMRLQQRGRYLCGPIRLMTRFPLGLVERSYMMSNPGEILVYPNIGHLTPQWHREQLDADELVQQNRSRGGTFEDEFHRLREYRHGDNLRSIHWRTTARRNQLMVREHHQMRDQDLALILDLWLPLGASAAERERVELALSFAATVCVEHCQKSRESSIYVGIAGQAFRQWSGAAGPQTMPQMLDEFAVAEGAPTGDVRKAVESCLQMRSSHVQRLLITTRGERQPEFKLIQQVLTDSQHRGFPLRLVSAWPETLQRFYHSSISAAQGTDSPVAGI